MTKMQRCLTICFSVLYAGIGSADARGGDWPQWGGRSERNMVSDEKGLPDLRPPEGQQAMSLSDPANPYVKWKVKLTANTYGNPTVADGRVFVTTAGKGCGRVVCVDEATGKLVWELIAPHRNFATPLRPEKWAKGSHWDYYVVSPGGKSLGICSSPTVDGDRVYVLTHRGEVLCLDVGGLADGNQGPFVDEAKYKSELQGQSAELTSTDADIIWCYDLWTELVIRPADTFSNSALVHGDFVYISTGNGVELHSGKWIEPACPPNPQAPSFIALDKHTGRLVAQDNEKIGTRVLHGQFSSPSLARVAGKTLVLYGGGDAVLYAFEPLTKMPDEPVKLKKVWSYDCMLPEYWVKDDQGKLIDYRAGDRRSLLSVGKYGNKADTADYVGASSIIATPAVHQGRVYLAIGRDPAHGRGRGAFHCIDASGTGDISKTGNVWTYKAIQRSISTASVADGLVYLADASGWIHCLDADTGECHWTHDTGSYRHNGAIWASTLLADGKVYLTTRKTFWVFAAGKEKKVLSTLRLNGECTPIAANGVLYVVLRGNLWALHQPSGIASR